MALAPSCDSQLPPLLTSKRQTGAQRKLGHLKAAYSRTNSVSKGRSIGAYHGDSGSVHMFIDIAKVEEVKLTHS